MSDKFSFDAVHEDSNTIIKAMIIKDHLLKSKDKKKDKDGNKKKPPALCMQLLRPESIAQYELSLGRE